MTIDVDRLRAEIEADPSRAIRGLEALEASLDTASRDRHSEIDVDADVANALSELARIEAMADLAARDRSIRIDIDRGALAGIAATIGTLRGVLDGAADGLRSVTGAAGAAAGALGGGGGSGGGGGFAGAAGGAGRAGSLLAGTLVGLGQGLAGAAVSVGILLAVVSALPGAFAAAAAAGGIFLGMIGPLVGLLGAIVPLAGAFVTVLGALGLALVPVIQGVSAYREASKGAAEQAQALTEKNHALTQSNWALQMATQQVARAEETLKEAREALAAAPLAAAEALEDQHFATRQAILSERQAVLALEEAQANLAAAQEESARAGMVLTKQTDAFTGKQYDVAYASAAAVDSAADERAARLAVQQAELDLARARDQSQDMQRLLNEMERKGIQNSDIMVDARRRVRDAEMALAAAHHAVANAQYQQRQAQQALNDQVTKGTAAMQTWQEAMGRLSPAGREFVQFIADEFMPAFGDLSKVAQEAMLPGIQSGLTTLMGSFGAVKREVRIVSGLIGDAFDDFMTFWTEPAQKETLRETFRGLNRVIRSGLDLLQPFSRALANISIAASPMVVTIMEGIGDQLDRFSTWAEGPGKDDLRNFFDDAAHFAGLWWEVLKPIGGILKAIVRAAKPFAEAGLTSLSDWLTSMSDFLNSPEGQTGLKDYFEDAMPALKELGGLIGDMFGLLFNSSVGGEDSAFYKALKVLREDVLPPIASLFEELDQSDLLPALVKYFGAAVTILGALNWEAIGAKIMVIATGLSWIAKSIRWAADLLAKWEIPVTPFGMLKQMAGALFRLEIPKWSEDAGKAVVGSWDGVAGWFTTHVTGPVGRFFGSMWGAINRGAQSAWNWVKSLWDGLVNWFDINVWTPLSDSWDSLIEGLKQTWEDFTDWIADHVPDLPIPDLNPGEGGGVDLTPFWDGAVPGMWTGGAAKKGQPYVVGEKRPELFVPSTSGRIMPRATPTDLGFDQSRGITEEQLDRLIDKLLDRAKPDVKMENNFREKVDPHHLARELAWSLS